MHDNWLIAISLFTAAAGMTVLLFVLIFHELPESDVAGAEGAADGTWVRLRGNITDLQHRGNMTIITLTQPASIEVVLFEKINASGCIVVQGKRGEYENNAQITAAMLRQC